MSHLAQAIRDELGEDCVEVHTDTYIVYLILNILGEGYDVIDIEIMAVDAVVLKFIIVRINVLAQEIKLIIVTPVDIALVPLASAQIFTDGDLINLYHPVRQEGMMPVTGVDTGLVNTDGTFKVRLVGNLHRREVIGTGSNLVQDMILDKTAQGIDTVSEILKTMTRGIYILRIDRVIEIACQFVKGTEVAFLNTVFAL